MKDGRLLVAGALGALAWAGRRRGSSDRWRQAWCETDMTSAAWVSPEGVVHELSGLDDHVNWARRHLEETDQMRFNCGFTTFTDPEVEAAVEQSGSITSALTVQGWIRMTNVLHFGIWDENVVTDAAMEAVAELVAQCIEAGNSDPEDLNDIIHIGSDARSWRPAPGSPHDIPDFVRQWLGRSRMERMYEVLLDRG